MALEIEKVRPVYQKYTRATYLGLDLYEEFIWKST